jgi:hypothetical protein
VSPKLDPQLMVLMRGVRPFKRHGLAGEVGHCRCALEGYVGTLAPSVLSLLLGCHEVNNFAPTCTLLPIMMSCLTTGRQETTTETSKS